MHTKFKRYTNFMVFPRSFLDNESRNNTNKKKKGIAFKTTLFNIKLSKSDIYYPFRYNAFKNLFDYLGSFKLSMHLIK